MSYPARAEGLVNRITIGIIVILIVPWQGPSTYLSFCFFDFHSVIPRDGKVRNMANSLSLSLSYITKSGLLARIRWSVYISKSQKILSVSFYRTDSGLYFLVVWSIFSLLHNSQRSPFPQFEWQQVSSSPRGCPRGVMVKAMNCGIVVREFVLQSRYYVHFRANTLGKGMNPLILPPAMG